MDNLRRNSYAYVAVLSVAVSIITATSCFAEDIRVFSGGAPREALNALTREFEQRTGHKDTPSGAQMARVLEQLGIVEAMQSKTLHHNFLDGGADLILKGQADFGFYPESAIMSVKGVAVAGTLPQSLDRLTIYSAAVVATEHRRDSD